MEKKQRLLSHLIQFEKLMKELPDTAESVPRFLKFLRIFFRNKHPELSLPSIEIISIIKHEKPTVYYYVRKHAGRDRILQLIVDVEIDVEQAYERLNAFKNKL